MMLEDQDGLWMIYRDYSGSLGRVCYAGQWSLNFARRSTSNKMQILPHQLFLLPRALFPPQPSRNINGRSFSWLWFQSILGLGLILKCMNYLDGRSFWKCGKIGSLGVANAFRDLLEHGKKTIPTPESPIFIFKNSIFRAVQRFFLLFLAGSIGIWTSGEASTLQTHLA